MLMVACGLIDEQFVIIIIIACNKHYPLLCIYYEQILWEIRINKLLRRVSSLCSPGCLLQPQNSNWGCYIVTSTISKKVVIF